MRVLKFVFGGLFALLLVSVVLKALFFLMFAAMLIGGAFMARRAFMRFRGGYHPYYHRQWHHSAAQTWGFQQQQYIESIDELAQRQYSSTPAQRPAYREIDLI